MKIKDMRAYRRYYKEEVMDLRGVSNRNEHFVAAHHSEEGHPDEFGFFSLVHGDKKGSGPEGFSAHLIAFLTMAHDGQAVYEFLQNAVDANSSEFLIRWGQTPGSDEKYVMILNDGEPFDLAGVQAILNIGMGTKSNDRSKIGKFGIGFKLAHRLVGRNDGRDELVREYQGPILFSWKNNDWRKLVGSDSIELIPTGNPTEEDDILWCSLNLGQVFG